MRQLKILMAGSLLSALAACQAGSASNDEQTETPLPEQLISCPGERPEVCTQQYDPVCGYFQPGPDDGESPSSREWATDSGTSARQRRTFGNACSACIETEVIGFVRGECPASQTR